MGCLTRAQLGCTGVPKWGAQLGAQLGFPTRAPNSRTGMPNWGAQLAWRAQLGCPTVVCLRVLQGCGSSILRAIPRRCAQWCAKGGVGNSVGNSQKRIADRQFFEDDFMKENCRGIADPELPKNCRENCRPPLLHTIARICAEFRAELPIPTLAVCQAHSPPAAQVGCAPTPPDNPKTRPGPPRSSVDFPFFRVKRENRLAQTQTPPNAQASQTLP